MSEPARPSDEAPDESSDLSPTRQSDEHEFAEETELVQDASAIDETIVSAELEDELDDDDVEDEDEDDDDEEDEYEEDGEDDEVDEDEEFDEDQDDQEDEVADERNQVDEPLVAAADTAPAIRVATPAPHFAPAWASRRAHAEGVRCQDAAGQPWVDAMAGRVSAVGLGCEAIADAIRQTAGAYLGDASQTLEIADDEQPELAVAIRQMLQSTDNQNAIAADSCLLFSDADLAIEAMVTFARTRNAETSYRTIALAGADHGRTALCRSASGQPSLHQGFGPMVAGFDHVKPNDLKALESAIDESTAAVLLSPVNLSNAARPLDANYLSKVRQVCDQRDLMLLIDESRLCFGASGSCFSYTSLCDIPVDGIVVAAGLFSGLPGGLLIASERLTGHPIQQSINYPMQRNVVIAMLDELSRLRLPHAVSESAQTFAVALAEAIAGFEFIRDIHVTGMTIGIETDLAATEMVSAAARNGLRIEPAGETSIRLQPPIHFSDEDRHALLERLVETMQAIEQSSTELSA
ncbi:bifunctional N-succinyldiaminopimelate-aminotransferase/acetylornithine transaminase protein [Rhodopirellula maiorica SM1]|uniref:Bifunctional N-succinyldiaminopimelate-aminotransferase/acetylornithine transaminase protein n=1 Tax=Rhodopirellula maiorica SM1 TaxID=1265738 RepID=M5RDB9_9BACT|nr:aminotransferase class III-fold pyridoxal phosphate-dependent enzyme [Rhodopirellula maiorica]EMI17483.1 bifunctional N-succinyldiaminopimelate-aminotransferase/acetylornithine transaminase protein [Rhodopirellula maiorica SM1]